MRPLFGDRILEFVLSADIMDSKTFEELMDIIYKYLSVEFDVASFSVLVADETEGGGSLLVAKTTSEDDYPPVVVTSESGFHVAYSFLKNQPLWIVDRSKGLLRGSSDLQDLWSDAKDIPTQLKRHTDDDNRTMILHPIRRSGSEGNAMGLIEVTAEEFVKPSPAGLEEIQTLANLVGRAVQMLELRQDMQDNTRRALRSLERSLEIGQWARLEIPAVFVAFPGIEKDSEYAADQASILTCIKDVLGEFAHLEVVFWDNMSESGSIMEQVAGEIRDASMGVCLLSEPISSEEPSLEDSDVTYKFDDNPNVLYEAGMMQALAKSYGSLMQGWIPIREEDSAPRPFDLAGERTITVPRNEEGHFDESVFTEIFRRYVAEIYKSVEREV